MKLGIAWVGLVVAMAVGGGAVGCKTGEGVGGIGDEPEHCALACESSPDEPELDCYLVDAYGGSAETGWTEVPDGVREPNCCNVSALPGEDPDEWLPPRCFPAPRLRP